MQKKLTVLILCLILGAATALSACSAKETKDSNTNQSESEEKDSTASQSEGEEKDSTASQSESEEKILATDFEVTLLSGETVKLSDYLGKKVLVNFWATWCGPCVQEMPAFQRLSEDYPDEFVILAVNCGDSEAEVRDFAEENGYTFNIAPDENLEASSLYPTTSIPLTLIVDEEGYVTYASYGAADADSMYELYKNELGL